MTISRTSLLGPIALICLNFAQLHADCESAAQPTPVSAPPKASSCGMSQNPMRITARHIESKGVGYDQGYTTLEGFFSPTESWINEWTPFLDVRGHVFNNGKFAANAGIGVRYLATSRLWGANIYYDYRNTTRQHYNQVSMGFESLGRVWDFRLNGYLPVGAKTSSWSDPQFAGFRGNSLYISRKREFVMGSANAEAGIHVDNFKDVPLYFAAGPYYLHGKQKTAWGGEIRARADVYEYLTLEANTSYDSAFHWIGQGQVGLNFYFGGKRQVKQCKSRSCAKAMTLANRALQRVDRNEIIPVDRRRKSVKADLPFSFIFVNNLSSSNGTWESPYPTLQQAEIAASPNDVIYVLPGSGASYIVSGPSGFLMQEGQKLWGAATSHSVDTQFGSVEIPKLANFMPKVENTLPGGTATVVTMANGCEVSGMHVLGADVHFGIFAGLDGINQTVSINHNLVEISSISGPLELTGIQADNLGVDSMTASIADNQCFNLFSLGGDVTGFLVRNLNGGSMVASITDNQLSTLTGDSVNAINTISFGGSMILSIIGNQVSNITGPSDARGFTVTNSSSDALVVSLIDNQLSTLSADKGILIANSTAGNICATLIGNNTGFPNELFNTILGTFIEDLSSGDNTPAFTSTGPGTITPGNCP